MTYCGVYCVYKIYMNIDKNEKKKIMATKPPSFTIKGLLPIASKIALYTSPSQIAIILKEFGFEESISNPAEAEVVILRVFKTFRAENNNEGIKKIIGRFLTFYGQLVNEKHHNTGFVTQVREILSRGHFTLAYNTVRKEYLVIPYEGVVHAISMCIDGTNESDFLEPPQIKMRSVSSPQLNPDNFYIVDDGDGYRYKGALLDKLSKKTDYFIVFDVIYKLIPTGGFETYENIGKQVKGRIRKTRNFSQKKMTTFIQNNLYEHNGFLHYAKKINNTLTGGKRLIQTIRGEGIEFNNNRKS